MESTQGRYGQRPEITGSWQDGIDKSRNRLQLVTTQDPSKIAMRSTGDEAAELITTPAQVLLLADSVREGRFDHVIKPLA